MTTRREILDNSYMLLTVFGMDIGDFSLYAEVPICKRKATGSHTADKSCAPRAYETGGVPSGACLGPQLSPIQKLPSPSDWGWIVSADELWIPFWTALPEAAKSCKELVKCQCKKACRASCKCVKSSLTCTELCFCGGTCYRGE